MSIGTPRSANLAVTPRLRFRIDSPCSPDADQQSASRPIVVTPDFGLPFEENIA
jgi:hypothetical protein